MDTMAGRTIAPQDLPVSQVAETSQRIAASVGAVMAGREDSIRLAIACMLSGGHLLIEDIPGVGKTLLAQALAASVGGSFHRIQGTPDLLPGDVRAPALDDVNEVGVGRIVVGMDHVMDDAGMLLVRREQLLEDCPRLEIIRLVAGAMGTAERG